MASFQAIPAVCEAVLALLQANYSPEDFNSELEFKAYQATDFSQESITAGVSLFLYRIFPDGTRRSPTGRIGPNGHRYRPKLPVDLHFLLTAWGRHASLQYAIASWMMRTLEDTPILPVGLLNSVASDVFDPDETIELVLAELSNEDMFRIWDTLTEKVYQLSVPYIARNVRIESTRVQTLGEPVQERTFEYRNVDNGSTF